MAVGALEKAKVPDVVGSMTEAQALNPPFSLADDSPSLGELAGAVARRSPVARGMAEAAFLGRNRGQIDRLGSAVEGNLGPIGNTLELSRALSQTRTNAAPLYD
ncbi:hypothetical protein AB5I41_31440 [Sphingomonas sp. MMS24-JH45]